MFKNMIENKILTQKGQKSDRADKCTIMGALHNEN